MMAGTEQPNPVSIGMKAFPERPNLRKARSRMKAILAQMKEDPQYQDIRECAAAINGEPYLYSIDLMSEKYAKALANGAESHEADE